MSPQSENSFEGMPGKIPDEPEKGSFQKWRSNLFLKRIHHQWDRMTQIQ